MIFWGQGGEWILSVQPRLMGQSDYPMLGMNKKAVVSWQLGGREVEVEVGEKMVYFGTNQTFKSDLKCWGTGRAGKPQT